MSDRPASGRATSSATVWLVVAFLLAACGGSQPGPTASTGLPSPTSVASGATTPASQPPPTVLTPTAAPPTAVATVPPTGTPPPQCDPGVICEGSVTAGTYSTVSLGITAGFTLAGDGWIGGGDVLHDGFRLSNNAVGGDHVIAVTTWDRNWPGDSCVPTGSAKVDATVAEFIARLVGTPGINESQSVPRTIAGWPATQVDISVASECPEAGRLYMWPSAGGHRYSFDDGDRARVIAFRVELPRAVGLVPLVKFIIVVVEAGPGADLDLLLRKADELLATMTIAL